MIQRQGVHTLSCRGRLAHHGPLLFVLFHEVSVSLAGRDSGARPGEVRLLLYVAGQKVAQQLIEQLK